ncbi:selenoprotein S-like [Dreissena polymorpha]|uniref:selenoprotein S-like n=1 Tax=Dreissena polymorpha TaxID=45954 RepID=UPI0022655630|nr:selenoprotein S-like [Dreissena polymorpha]
MDDAQPDAGAPEATEHPQELVNENPLAGPFYIVLGCLESYGWLIVLAIVIALYLKSTLSPAVRKYKEKLNETIQNKKFDPEEASARELAREAARRRMQEQLDAQAARHAEMMKQKEEEKRQEKIKDWENHLEGNGYRSKTKPKQESEIQKPLKTEKKSKPLRSSDFNPLAGDGGSSGWRPVARRGGGG